MFHSKIVIFFKKIFLSISGCSSFNRQRQNAFLNILLRSRLVLSERHKRGHFKNSLFRELFEDFLVSNLDYCPKFNRRWNAQIILKYFIFQSGIFIFNDNFFKVSFQARVVLYARTIKFIRDHTSFHSGTKNNKIKS